jgi:Uma2 family endonuclease
MSLLTLEQTIPELVGTEAQIHETITQTNGASAASDYTKFQFPRQGEWTYEQWLQFPNDGWKYEIIDGVLYMSPPPTINHQDVSGELFTRMRLFARSHKLGVVLAAPCGVRLPTQPVPVEPDILFVRRERRSIIAERYVEGAPDLVVEVLSRSNADYDRTTKYRQYELAGVAEYWIVNCWDQTVAIYLLVNQRYQLTHTYQRGETAALQGLTGFQIAVADLFDLE